MRRGVGRTELLIGAAVVVVLVLIAVPILMGTGKKSARAEVPLLVDQIRELELTYRASFGDYVSAEPSPRAPHLVDAVAVAWSSNRGFDTIGFAPPEPDAVYGSYKIAATETGFTVTGTCDVDGDGRRAVYVATESEPARLITDAGVY